MDEFFIFDILFFWFHCLFHLSYRTAVSIAIMFAASSPLSAAATVGDAAERNSPKLICFSSQFPNVFVFSAKKYLHENPTCQTSGFRPKSKKLKSVKIHLKENVHYLSFYVDVEQWAKERK
jgi:hypothetical protein